MPLFHERSGAFSPEKTVSLLLTLLPALWLAGRALAGDLGPRPFTEAIHFSGLWALRFLALGLAVTPARKLLNWPKLFFARRIFGLATLGYALAHVALYMVDQGLGRALSEIVARVYLTIGAVAVALLLVLGATSFNGAIRRLGARRWNRLHALVFAIVPLALLHFFFQSKLDVNEPVLMTGAFVFLIGYRIAERFFGAPGPLVLAGLAVVGAVLTGAIEIAWYGLATRVDPWRVAEADFAFDLGLRPVWWVLMGGLAVALLAFLLKIFRRPTRRAPRLQPEAR